MAINGVSGTNNDVPVVDPDKVGFNGLTSTDFMKLLITQLQNQDPTDPTSNEELLSQVSMMRNLQSNIELGDAVKAITTNQQLTTAANLIGREIEGVNNDDQAVMGIADRAFMADGVAYLGVGSQAVKLSTVTSVNAV